MLVLAMMGLWAWSFGLVPIPDQGFVLNVDLAKRISAAVGSDIDSLKKQSSETSAKVDNIKTALDQILADYYSKRIKDGMRQRCKLDPLNAAERDRLWDQITKDVSLYRQYSGDRDYTRPSCQEV